MLVEARGLSAQQQQAEGHHRHSGHQTVGCGVMLSVLLGSGQQLVEGDENDDSGDPGEYHTQGGVSDPWPEQGITD